MRPHFYRVSFRSAFCVCANSRHGGRKRIIYGMTWRIRFMNDVTVVVMSRFKSKFTRNCDKFTFDLSGDIQLDEMAKRLAEYDATLNSAFGLLTFKMLDRKVSMFANGNVVLKGITSVGEAERIAQKILALIDPHIVLQVSAVDRVDH